MGKASVAGLGGGADDEAVNLSVSIGTLSLAGVDATQTSYSTYEFPLPDGTRVVCVYYRTWGSNNYPDFCLYLPLQCCTGAMNGQWFTAPKSFAGIDIYGCKGIEVVSDLLKFTCTCPTGFSISFTAYK